jgi:soluble lytic murein transglycosylase-like protein
MRIITYYKKHLLALSVAVAGGSFAATALAGGQAEGVLSASVRAVMQRAVADQAAPKLAFTSQQEAQFWLTEMSDRLQKKIPDEASRREFLSTVHYEAVRAGLDPHLVLSLIQVESGVPRGRARLYAGHAVLGKVYRYSRT